MKKLIVIGIGNRIMMDDAIGIYLVEDMLLQDKNPDVTHILGETDVDFCTDAVLNYTNIIVIDAFLSGKQPGEVSEVSLEKLNYDNEACLYSIHGLHLLKQLIRNLRSQAVTLIGIEPYEIKYGFTLSDMLKKRYSSISCEVNSLIDKYIEENLEKRQC